MKNDGSSRPASHEGAENKTEDRMTHARAMEEWPDYAAEWKAPGAVVARGIRIFRQVALMAALGRSRGAAPVCRITEAAVSIFRKMMQEIAGAVERLDASGSKGKLDHPDDVVCLRRLLEIGQTIENHLRPAGRDGSEYMAPISAFAPISAISKGEDATFRPYLPDGERFVAIKATLAAIQETRMGVSASRPSHGDG